MMKLFIYSGLFLSFLSCEKPLPQKPKVIYSHTYHDSIKKINIQLPELKRDSLHLDMDSNQNP